MPTGAANLLAAAQKFHAGQFPATITIAGQTYDVGTTGIRREERLVEGGRIDVRAVSFWLPRQALDDAGQPEPQAGDTIERAGEKFVLDAISRDATGTTLILHCVELG